MPGDDRVTVTITRDDVVLVEHGRIESGPAISGSLEPERAAHVRAEVAGSVIQTYAERGQPVERGTLLARIDDTGLRDEQLSARSAVTTASESLRLAERDADRTARLLEAGAVAEREHEDARIAVRTAQSQLADAQARLALAERQLSSTRVSVPFTGVVSERQVNPGDVVQPGTALYTIVDLTSMQLEAAVPASELDAVRVGAPVEFTVNGYPGRTFSGVVERIQPTVDPATGQVLIIASVPNPRGHLMAGLFAEGWIGTETRVGLSAPLVAIDFTGDASSVLRIGRGVVERVPVRTGLRDERTERVELVAGVAEGDTLLLGAALDITPGTRVRIEALEPRALDGK